MSRRGRKPPGAPLDRDDAALWADYTRSIKRLKQPRAAAGTDQPNVAKPLQPPQASRPQSSDPQELKRSTVVPRAPVSAFAKAPPQPASPIERKLVRRVQRGLHDIDATIDLHGLTQAEAKPRLIAFLRQAQLRDFRMVLVITGKGRGRSNDNPFVSRNEGGILRRAVRLWLDHGECGSLVVGYSRAHQRHGGDGALYVQIRRSRQNSADGEKF